MSRTNLKQQLMKQQLIQQEMREKQMQSRIGLTSHALQPQHTHHSNVEFGNIHSQQMIRNVQQSQQMRQQLENPTNYHVLQTQKQQNFCESPEDIQLIHEHIQQSLQSCQERQPLNGLSVSSGPQSPFALSPDSPLSAPPSSVCSTSELDDVFDVLGGFDNREINQMDEEIVGAIAATLPNDINYFLEDSTTTASTPTMETVSSSCPQLTEQELKAWQKDRQKKDNHNQIERRRRYNINDRIKELGTLLPKSDETKHFDLVKDMKQNKGTILKASVDYVRLLKRENTRLNEQEKKYKEIESNNRCLQMKIKQLELIRDNQNCNSNQNIHWSSNNQTINCNPNIGNNDMLLSATISRSDPFLNSSVNHLPLTESDQLAVTQSLQTIIKREIMTSISPLSPSHSSSGIGSSIPSASPQQQQYFQFNELNERRHDPILSATSLSIKNEAHSPQSMDICN